MSSFENNPYSGLNTEPLQWTHPYSGRGETKCQLWTHVQFREPVTAGSVISRLKATGMG